MTAWLKQSTAVTVKVGPFLDDADGNTIEAGLTITQADVRLSKNGGNMAQKAEASSLTHDELGWYNCALDTTDTGTLGSLKVIVHESGALQVWHEFMVVPANVYDSLFGADNLQVDAVQIEGTDATDAIDARLAAYDAVVPADLPTNFADLAITATTGRVDIATNNDKSGYSISGTLTTLDALDTAQDTQHSTTQTAIGNLNDLSDAQVNAEVDTALADIHLDHLFATDYDPASKPGTATALLNELVESDAGVSRFTANALEEAPTGGSAPTAGEIADAVWDEAKAGHVGAGSFGEEVQAHALGSEVAALNDLDSTEVQTAAAAALTAYDPPTNTEMEARTLVAANYATAANQTTILNRLGAFTGSGVNSVLGFFQALMRSDATTPTDLGGTYDDATDSLQAIRDRGDSAWVTAVGFATHSAADVWAVATRVLTAGTNIALAKGTGVTGFNDLSASEVNDEVVDALNVDTYPEPGQGAPAATDSIVGKIGNLHKAWRNRTTQTADTYSLYADDATTVDQAATVSDDGTTFDRGEIGSGA